MSGPERVRSEVEGAGMAVRLAKGYNAYGRTTLRE